MPNSVRVKYVLWLLNSTIKAFENIDIWSDHLLTNEMIRLQYNEVLFRLLGSK